MCVQEPCVYLLSATSVVVRNNSILDDFDLANLVKCYIFDHYVKHALECEEFPAELQENLRQQLGQVLGKIGTIKVAKTSVTQGVSVEENNQLITVCRMEIEDLLERLPQLDYFESLPLSCDEKKKFLKH